MLHRPEDSIQSVLGVRVSEVSVSNSSPKTFNNVNDASFVIINFGYNKQSYVATYSNNGYVLTTLHNNLDSRLTVSGGEDSITISTTSGSFGLRVIILG